MVSKHLLRRAPWSLLLLAAGLLLAVSPSFGQKTDINVNLYGAFPSSATGSSLNADLTPAPGPALQQKAYPSAGFRIGVRHIFSPIFGLEMNYGYNRATQHFTGGTSFQQGDVYSHAKPFTLDYVATAPFSLLGVQPFVLAGGGLISYNISSYVNPPAQTPLVRPEKIPVIEYGVGADFHPGMLPPFIALRLQYRGLIGHAPDYRQPLLATHNVINIAEPQIGLAFKF